jgi:hypothetical protein
MRRLLSLLAILPLLAAAVMAQVEVQRNVLFHATAVPHGSGPAPFVQALGGPVATYQYIQSEAGPPGEAVKNAPYSAEGVTEFTQTLADGTRITRKTTSAVYRDSDGRTRREMTLNMIGPLGSGDAPKNITISDPNDNVYILDPETKTARVLPKLGDVKVMMGEQPALAANKLMLAEPHSAGQTVMVIRRHEQGGQAPKMESLGQQTIEGLVADGSRVTTTIPAGEIGNDRPITTVTERWLSPELKVVVMTRTASPLTGETVYRLTNVRRGDPPAQLFQLPPDYTVVKDQPFFRKMVKVHDEVKEGPK